MRVLVSSTSGYGHVLPMVPLAHALQARGHEVLWATGADAGELVRAAGIETVAAGLTDELFRARRADLLREAAKVRPEDLAAHMFPRIFGGARARPMLDDLRPVARRFAPDLLLHEQGELAAPLVGTELGVPHVTHAFGGATPARSVTEAGERVAGLWAALGQPVPPYAGCYEHLYLDICPPSLQTVSLAHVRAVQPVRPVAYAGEAAAVPDAVLSRLAGAGSQPLVYLTLGTVYTGTSMLGPVVTALAGLGVRLLVTVGPHGDPGALGDQPEHVVVARYVPQTAVLPLCTAVVSHAGSGTMLATAALGMPQVCLPQAADQFRNAEGIVRARAGLALHPDEATPAAVAHALRDVLDRADLRAGARAVAAEIEAMPAPDEVVVRLEGLVSPEPVPTPGRR